MRARRREISIFSMSALDLFASALGAFILIAVVMMPFFPNTGDSPERIANVREELQAARARNQALRRQLAELEAALAQARDSQLPNLDLVIVVDVTGSMRELLDGLRAEITGIIRVLAEMTPELGVGIVWFGDEDWERPTGSLELSRVTGSPARRTRLLDYVKGLRIQMGRGSGGNDDNPEALYAGLRIAVAQPWRAAAEERVIVIITDNPAYERERQPSVAAARAFAERDGSRVSTVYRPTGSGAPETQAFLAELARAGNGRYTVSGASPLGDLLLSLL